jgi:hypothetical protein
MSTLTDRPGSQDTPQDGPPQEDTRQDTRRDRQLSAIPAREDTPRVGDRMVGRDKWGADYDLQFCGDGRWRGQTRGTPPVVFSLGADVAREWRQRHHAAQSRQVAA